MPLVRDETLDVAVVQRTLAAVGPGLKFRALYRDRMVIACRRGHPLRGARSPRELADARWLGFNAPGSGSWLEKAFPAVGLAFPRRFTMCESFAFAFELMARTDAVMAMPAPVSAGSLSRGLLEEIPLEEQLPPFVLGLGTRTETQMTSLATALARGSRLSATVAASEISTRPGSGVLDLETIPSPGVYRRADRDRTDKAGSRVKIARLKASTTTT